MSADKRMPQALSPADKFNQLNEVFGTRRLARLLRTRPGHLIAYANRELPLGGRRSERLEVLHDVVEGLRGSYNPIGINQWFERKRTALGHQSPRAVFESCAWRRNDRLVKQVKRLARDTAAAPATGVT